jgi:hypothetical protein
VDRSTFVKGYTKILTNAWSDDTFKQRLQSDPKSVLGEYGLDVPASATVDIVMGTQGEGSLDDQVSIWEQGENTGSYTLYVPEVPQVEEGELSEAELDSVSGAGDEYCCCCCPCCTCT